MNKENYQKIIHFLEPDPFSGGEKTYLCGEPAYRFIYHLLSKKLTKNKKEALLIDSANVFDPYKLVKEAKERKSQELLDRVKVCRAFTAYQLLDIIHKRTKKAFNNKTRYLVVFEPIYLFLDEEIEKKERLNLINNILSRLNCFVNNETDLILIDNISRFNDTLNTFSSQKIVFKEKKEGVRVKWRDNFIQFNPQIHVHQTTLNKYLEELGRLKKPIFFERPQKKIKDFIEA